MSDETFCGNCGAKIIMDARFCPECGYPIKADAWPPVPPLQSEVPPTEKMDYPPQALPGFDPGLGYPPGPVPKKSNRNLYFIGAGLIVAICCVLGGGYLVLKGLLSDKSDSPLAFLSKATETPTKVPPTKTPVPTEVPSIQPPPAQATPAQAPPALVGKQEVTENSFFDDFSSNALGWKDEMNPNSGTGFEDGRYFIQVNVPDYRQIAFTPLKSLTHIEFSAEVAYGAGNGAFGVACYWQNFDNHHYVYFDLSRNTYFIGRVENKKWIDMTDRLKFPKAIGFQRYAVDCTPGMISVYINDALVNELSVNMPVQDYNMVLGVMGWSDAAEGGIKVLFDYASGYKAVQ